MKRFQLLFTCAVLAIATGGFAQNYKPTWESLNTRKIPGWFHQEKFGIFIHWGVYAVPAYAPVIPNSGYSYSEWYWFRLPEKQKDFLSFHEKNFGKDFQYPQFESSFRAELFNPSDWAALFKKSGAKYVVLTSKHHEGYCLWDNREADQTWKRPWNAVTGTPKRNLLGELSTAVRAEGLRMGYYYSLYEWFNPLWLSDKPRYVREHMTPQFKDLVTRYKPDVIFSDGEWDLTDKEWKSEELLAWLYNESPVKDYVVVNDRWGSNTREKNTASTYTTSEYGSGMDASITWEENQGIGHSYGYNRNEKLSDYKTSEELILLLCDIVSRGGNLLLDVGPTADGRIPVIMQQRLTDIGQWLSVNGDAIYGSEAWSSNRQWSSGPMPAKKGKSFMAGYSIAKLVKQRSDSAYVECFFTRKAKDLYCILPTWRERISLNDVHTTAATTVRVLGSDRKILWKKNGNKLEIDMSTIRPGDISSTGILVLQITGAATP